MNSTEANLICSFLADERFCFPPDGAPVGYPVKDKHVFLIDEWREVGAGRVGEIAVTSRYLPPGTWDVSTHSSPREEAMCLTGDLGRAHPDGFVVYLGRKNLAVKLRGYRVHPAEIEAPLAVHKGIKDAAVLAWDGGGESQCLGAYLVAASDLKPTVTEITHWLNATLPDYMIPLAMSGWNRCRG